MNQTSPDPIDRRSSTRRACLLVVRYKTDGSWRPATAVDLSERGCRLRIGEDPPRGAAVRLAFARPQKEGQAQPEVRATGTVMWCRLEGLSHQAGVHFTERLMEVDELLLD